MTSTKPCNTFQSVLVVMLCQENLEHFSYFTLRFVYDWRTEFGKIEQSLAASVKYEPRRGVTEEVPAVGFCLGSGLFGSYNSD